MGCMISTYLFHNPHHPFKCIFHFIEQISPHAVPTICAEMVVRPETDLAIDSGSLQVNIDMQQLSRVRPVGLRPCRAVGVPGCVPGVRCKSLNRQPYCKLDLVYHGT